MHSFLHYFFASFELGSSYSCGALYANRSAPLHLLIVCCRGLHVVLLAQGTASCSASVHPVSCTATLVVLCVHTGQQILHASLLWYLLCIGSHLQWQNHILLPCCLATVFTQTKFVLLCSR